MYDCATNMWLCHAHVDVQYVLYPGNVWHMWLTSFDSLCVSRRSLHQPRAESFNGITQRNNIANGAPRPIRRQATTATCAPSAAADRSRSPVQQQESQESRDADSPVLGLTQRAFSDNNVHTYPWYLRSLVVVVVVFSADSRERWLWPKALYFF